MSSPAIYLVDDDPAIVTAVSRLLHACGYEVRPFLSPSDFLRQHDARQPGCAVLDISMPGLTGLAVQDALSASGNERQIVFITGEGDIETSVRAMRAGAVDFLTKPFDADHLIVAVEAALARDRVARAARSVTDAVEGRLATLTVRERQVLELVVAGRLNKQTARDLGIAEKTVKVHRGRMMEKMKVGSVAELVRVTAPVFAGVTSRPSSPKDGDRTA
jgi:FixJ family two-component response regulator